MKQLNDLKIGIRLSVFISATVILILFILGIYLYHLQRNKIIQDANTSMTEQVGDLCNLVKLQIKERQEQVNSAMNVAIELINTAGTLVLDQNNKINVVATDQISQKTKKVQIPSLYFDDHLIYNNTSIVDKITRLTKARATIFQKMEGGYLRISTSVLNADGNRATNTFITNDSPVIKITERGPNFNGRAFVVDDWYITSYRPLKIDNSIIGILFVGIPEKNMKNIKEIFAQKKYLQSGYPFIIDKNGKFIVHPEKEGSILNKEEEFFKKITEAKSENGKIFYTWKNKDKILYFKYVSDIESYICIFLYEDEMMQILDHMKNAIFMAILLGIVIIVLINIYIGRSISFSIQKGVDFAKKISEGDLTSELKIDQEDEIGILTKSLNQMVYKLREIVSTINRGVVEMAAASQQISSGSQQLSQGALYLKIK